MMISIDQQLGGNSVVVDLGARTCIQAIILRGMGSKLPVVNLDVFKTALSIGEKLCNKLGVKDVVFGTTDLAESANFPGLTQFLKSQFGHRPLIAVSRHAICPFYDAAPYTRMFDYLIRDLAIAPGVHIERTGRFTPTFAQMQAAARG